MYLCPNCPVYLNCCVLSFFRKRLRRPRLRKAKILMEKRFRLSKKSTVVFNTNFGILPSTLRHIFSQRDAERHSVLQKQGGVNEICKKLYTSPDKGIEGTTEDIKNRIDSYGTNIQLQIPPKSFFFFVWEAMMDPLMLVLLCAALVAVGLSYLQSSQVSSHLDDDSIQGLIEGGSIFISVSAIITVAAFNNFQKDRQFKKLQEKVQSEQHITVIRNGIKSSIEACELVVGDVCMVYSGDKVPADGLILKSDDLSVDESSFTGLTTFSKKGPEDPFLIGGTYVTEGTGQMVICAVGQNSQQGQLLNLLDVTSCSFEVLQRAKSSLFGSKAIENGIEDLDNVEDDRDVDKSILQKKIDKLLFVIAVSGTVCATVTIVVQMVRFSVKKFLYEQKPWSNMYLNQYLSHIIFGFSVLVLCIPEGLPLAIAITLAYSVQKMMKDNNLVRHLNSCETMGNATIICTDKTGTLTTNRMTVTWMYICGSSLKQTDYKAFIPEFIQELITTGLSVNTSYKTTIQKSGQLSIGSKTECALLGLVQMLGVDYMNIRSKHPLESLVKIYPFSSVKKRMSTVINISEGGFRVHSTGAPEVLINNCSFIFGDKGILQTLTQEMKNNILKNYTNPMSSMGLRVICLAYREYISKGTPKMNQTLTASKIDWDREADLIKNLTLIAIFGIEDPLRPEVPAAIKDCHTAGIRVCMITGDNINTAQAIALKSGIIIPGDNSLQLEASELRKMVYSKGKFQQELFDKIWPDLKVLARATPNDKYVVVNGIINSKIHSNEEVVAVTGDGANDVPALLRADVGFSMGITGTDVAKEASDIIIQDDSFSSIVKAITWGRCIYDNITKFIQFQLGFNAVALSITLMGSCFNESPPIKAIQILWLNLLFDSFASVSFATEPPTRKLLRRKPYGRKRHLLSKIMLFNMFGQALYELSILAILLVKGKDWFPSRDTVHDCPHNTMLFNTYILMTLCNELCCRKVNAERNYLDGLHRNPIFCTVWICILIAQIIIIEYGGNIFGTCPLTYREWIVCAILAVGTFIAGYLILAIHWIVCRIF